MILYILDIIKFEKSEYCKELSKHKKHYAAGQYLLRMALGEEAFEQAQFVKGEHGKPYIIGHPIHYNISHSGQYVVLVVAESEVGVDVQEKKGKRLSAMAKRFFSEEEKRAVLAYDCTAKIGQNLPTKERDVEEGQTVEVGDCAKEQVELFFHIWCRKEAYGKYLGLGLLGDVLKTNMLEGVEGCYFQEYNKLEGYQISICCGKEEKVEEVVSVFEGL